MPIKKFQLLWLLLLLAIFVYFKYKRKNCVLDEFSGSVGHYPVTIKALKVEKKS